MERAAARHCRAEFHHKGEALCLLLPLTGEETRAAAEALVNRLVRQCHAPILPELAARRLRIAPQRLKALESCGLGPSLDVPTARHGKRYTLRAFSLSDMEKLALHLAGERPDA